MKRHIVLIEDEPAIRENYRDAFERRGYRVSAYGDRSSAFQALRTGLPDLAIIDVGLGDEPEGGFTLCQDLRVLSPTLPIIFLTARDSDIDSVHGLRLGADDYVTKDMSMDHLLARVTALLRRADAWSEALKQPDDTVTSHIKRIRRKFQGLDSSFDGIHTAYGMGYRWNAHEA
jgi:two-component system OmpR family response regulator